MPEILHLEWEWGANGRRPHANAAAHGWRRRNAAVIPTRSCERRRPLPAAVAAIARRSGDEKAGPFPV
ncbi:hypothetical protein GCM10009416_46230 [Craurococcus roseus]|uniref:Uncharacterized protein n=1 Tax=Craurococcus roseus TaxID=77585 RepID=A0ABN1G3B7_9PROT